MAKVRLICSLYPAMMLQRDSEGRTPLHGACRSSDAEVVLALCEAGGCEAASAPVVHPTREYHLMNDRLPLHNFVFEQWDKLKKAPLLSPWVDAFRLLLRLYPEAAGVIAKIPVPHHYTQNGIVGFGTTPYGMAVDKGLPAHYRRLLLRAAPDEGPAKLRRLNWSARRMAMFVAFAAQARKPLLLARLRYENKDLVKHVVSFL